VPELGSQSLLDGGGLSEFDRLTVFWSMDSINICELAKTVANLLGEGLSRRGSLQTDQVNEPVVARI